MSPQRYLKYRVDLRGPAPPGLMDWGFRLSRPPYDSLQPVQDVLALPNLPGPCVSPRLGWVLVASTRSLNPAATLAEISWLRAALPDLAIAVAPPARLDPVPLGGLLTRLSRRGAVVLVGDHDDPRVIADLVRAAFVPALDLTRWLSEALPGWDVRRRAQAIEDLLGGFDFDPETVRSRAAGCHLPRQQALWTRVGRALKAAWVAQLHPGTPALQLAWRAGYADARAMDRALRRIFGLTARELKATAGWEFLMWRFVCGCGDGAVRGWDQ